MTPKSYAELVRDAKSRIREIAAGAARVRLDANDGCVFLDVREADEVAFGTIPGAVWVPLGEVHGRVAAAVPMDAEVVVACARGNRSALAALAMQEMGYRRVVSLAGGMAAWIARGDPLGTPRG